MNDLNNIQKILELWISITGIDPNKQRFSLRDWSIQDMNETIKKTIELEQSNITALLLLDYFTDSYFLDRVFSVEELLKKPKVVSEYLQKCKEIKELLQTKELNDIREDFKHTVKKGLHHYDITNNKIFKSAENINLLTFLRRDALYALNDLHSFQFFQGEPDSKPLKFEQKIYEFWNVNSLLKTMANHYESGISLALIRDPSGYFSHFAFCIRNGGTITILTDKNRQLNPLSDQRSRRPDREFENRVYQYWFPYEILEYEQHEKGIHIPKYETTGIVSYNKKAYPIIDIKLLNPNTVIWLYMMFDLIKQKYGIKNHKLPELSYTSEMIKIEKALVDDKTIKSLAIVNYKEIKAPELTVETLKSKDMKGVFKDDKHFGSDINDWMIKRYKDKLVNSTKIFNLTIEKDNVIRYVTSDSLELKEKNEKDFYDEYGKYKSFVKNSIETYKFEKLDATLFGTEEQLLHDQKFIARYNQAQLLQVCADNEFKLRKDEIIKWYEEKVFENIDELLKCAVLDDFKVLDHHFHYSKDIIKNILSVHTYKKGTVFFKHAPGSIFHINKYLCVKNGSKASIAIKFTPNTPDALAKLCGCKIEELPDILQHWYLFKKYGGNSLLDDIDPLSWMLSNPWKKINFETGFHLSKREWNALCKKFNRLDRKDSLKEID